MAEEELVAIQTEDGKTYRVPPAVAAKFGVTDAADTSTAEIIAGAGHRPETDLRNPYLPDWMMDSVGSALDFLRPPFDYVKNASEEAVLRNMGDDSLGSKVAQGLAAMPGETVDFTT
jgi:hypothetical protein